MNKKLETYVEWLCKGDDPLFDCLGHGFAENDNTKYRFHAVDLRYPFYVSNQKNPKEGREVTGVLVEDLYIQEENNIVWAHMKASFPDTNFPIDYKTDVLVWRQYIGGFKGLKISRELEIPGNIHFDWFAFYTHSVCSDLRYEEFTKVTILKDLPYLAGRQITRTMHFPRVIRQRNTDIALFYNKTSTLVATAVIPKWKLEIKKVKPKPVTRFIGIALGLVDELKTVILESMVIQRSICDFLRQSRLESFFFLDTDSFLNTDFPFLCEGCKKSVSSLCVCSHIGQHVESFSWIDEMYVLVLEEYANLNGRLCHTSVGLASALLPEKIKVYRINDIFDPADLLGDAFEETLQRYAPLPNSQIYNSWTTAAVMDENSRLTIETID